MGYPKNTNCHQWFKVLYLLGILWLAFSCSGGSDNDNTIGENENPKVDIDSTETVDPTQTIDSTETNATPSTFIPTSFTAIGDVPYDNSQRDGLVALIEAHNDQNESQFVVHVGDIKPGGDDCNENVYENVSGLLRTFEKPTFIVLGDNEYNDCANPEQALSLWNQYFLDFHKNWEYEPKIDYQQERRENFAWVLNDVLYLGLNLVGSSVHDEAEWNQRLSDNADWVEEKFSELGENIEAGVVFGHANMTEINPQNFIAFTDRFRETAEKFEKPVLYLHGDGHFWFENRPWPEQNILRVQIQGGTEAVQVTVNPNLDEPFVFNRTFLN